MTIIKEYYQSDKNPPLFILRQPNYSSSLKKFLILFEEATNDFPKLKYENVRVIHFGGDRYRYTWGIEFNWPTNEIPEGYTKLETLEFLL